MSKRFFICFAKIIATGMAMLLCAAGGYLIAKKSALTQNSESAHNISDNSQYETDNVFPNLPVGVTGTYSPEENVIEDTNDYLVIRQGNLVNLYTINKDGEQIFERVLDIDPLSLREEDRTLLREGIVLGTKEALLSLIEDYSS